MSPRTLDLAEGMHAYLLEVGLREHPQLRELRELTDAMPDAGMRSSAEQAQLLAFLIELAGASRVLEIGCFTGYGTLAMALALPPGGRVVTLDVNEEWAALGRRHWRAAGVEERIELRLGLALETLDGLLAGGAAGTFDLAYVDADKKLYDAYYERALALVRAGGVVALDNVLWRGEVADPANQDRQTDALRTLNAKIHDDPRVSAVMLPIGDGLTLTRRRR
jgi:predicted O-methyltransferase YrrM